MLTQLAALLQTVSCTYELNPRFVVDTLYGMMALLPIGSTINHSVQDVIRGHGPLLQGLGLDGIETCPIATKKAKPRQCFFALLCVLRGSRIGAAFAFGGQDAGTANNPKRPGKGSLPNESEASATVTAIPTIGPIEDVAV